MVRKKISLCLLAPLLASLLLTGCGGAQNEEETTTAATLTDTAAVSTAETTEIAAETTETAPSGLTVIAADGSSAFKIIRDEEATTVIRDLAVELHHALNGAYNGKIGIGDDWVRGFGEKDSIETEDFEILIGDTNRKESATAKAQMGTNDYIICTIGNKIVIQGRNVLNVKYAAERFLEQFATGRAGEPMIVDIPEPICGMGRSQSIALTEGAEMRIMSFNVLAYGTLARRAPQIREVFHAYVPDIAGIQEGSSAIYDGVVDQLADRYTVAQRYHADGTLLSTPILYLTEKYTQIDSGAEWLEQNYFGSQKAITWVVLKSRETGKTFSVVNYHAAVLENTYKGYEDKSAEFCAALEKEYRIDNVRQILEIRDRIQTKYPGIAVFFTGDFAFSSTYEAYKGLDQAGLTTADVSSTGKKMAGYSTYNGSGIVGVSPGKGNPIDHVFHHPNESSVLRHHIAQEEKYELDASDHCAVWADVTVK